MVPINTFVFLNIGSYGLDCKYDWEFYDEPRICLKPVTRYQLLSRTYDLHNNVKVFKFQPLERFRFARSRSLYDLYLDDSVHYDLKNYLMALTPPVTLVAYNGYRFHYPMLRRALGQSLPSWLRCVDFMDAVYELEHGLSPRIDLDLGFLPWRNRLWREDYSYKFCDIYKRLTRGSYTKYRFGDSGVAVSNMKMLIECAAEISGSFVRWADYNASIFNNCTMLLDDVPRYYYAY